MANEKKNVRPPSLPRRSKRRRGTIPLYIYLEVESSSQFLHRILQKVNARLLPTTAIIYLLCYLDRSNIGIAHILNADTRDDNLSTNNISAFDFAIALMVFPVAYSLFEAPSNLALKMLSPKRWFGFLNIAFGVFCVGILVFFFLPNYPEHAGWLTEEEKVLQVRRMGIHSNASESKISWEDAKGTLLTWHFYGHYVAYLAVACGVSSLSLFSPTAVRGLGYRSLDTQLYTVPPYTIAYVVTVADRYKSRGIVAAESIVVGTIVYAVVGKI
ncbi:uncharacterized protein ALTATR162_LOCUS2326 [Alternaria atra]|uniref:Uncharacterized protein n=1 Tax=Alternaria atra TaxID=119953 RepID=A0A8J2MX83_9PLEO|nr:uncharacterized protein ALTATR162_LOCUS2326 [Alternaria atra]CAG5149253.1 unnamed protein product [Alternaria atra]